MKILFGEKVIQFIVTVVEPRLKVVILSPFCIEKSLINVPLSEAVASKVPSLLIDIEANLDSWAFIIFEFLLFLP